MSDDQGRHSSRELEVYLFTHLSARTLKLECYRREYFRAIMSQQATSHGRGLRMLLTPPSLRSLMRPSPLAVLVVQMKKLRILDNGTVLNNIRHQRTSCWEHSLVHELSILIREVTSRKRLDMSNIVYFVIKFYS